MKNVLIVEDTISNMNVAKQFFSSIEEKNNEYHFIYCENAAEAYSHMKEVFAVITDRSMPFSVDLPFSDSTLAHNREKNIKIEDLEEITYPSYGYELMLRFHREGKPIVMISCHGDHTGFAIVNTNSEQYQEVMSKLSTENPTNNSFFVKNAWMASKTISLNNSENTNKENVLVWEKAWEMLQKQLS